MKKITSLLCAIMLIMGLILHQTSYAIEFVQDNSIENNKREDEIEKNEIDDATNEVKNEKQNLVDNKEIDGLEIQEKLGDEQENSEEELNENETEEVNNPEEGEDTEAETVQLKEGIYTIRSVLLGNRAVGIDAGRTDNGANVNLWDYLEVGQQKFRFKIDIEGYYQIENIRSNKLLDVVSSGQASGTNVDQWEYNGGYDNQKWIIEKGTEAYKIKSKVNGLYLNLENGIGANGENINVETGANVRTQEFLIERIDEDGTETILNGSTNRIMTKLSNRAVGIDGGQTYNGAAVNLWDYIRVSQQRFRFEYHNGGYYTIVNENSGKLLDVVGSGSESWTQVDQWEDNGGYDNQKWIVKDIGNGYYNIISKINGLYLTVGGNGNNCDLMYVANPTGGDDQKFLIVDSGIPQGQKIVEEGTYKIVLAADSNRSLTVDGGNTSDGANVHIWDYLDTPQQQFNLVYDGYGYYEIIPVHSGKRIDVVGYGNESNVDQWTNNGGNDNQKWVIRKSKAGNYNIISKRDSLYLDAFQSKTDNGTNIQVYEKSGGNGQEFILEKIDNKSEKTIADGVYKIAPQANTNIVIEASASNTDNDGRVQIWEDFDAAAQRFKVDYLDGYYRISFEHSGKCLTVKWKNISSGTDVIQYEWNGGDNQKWVIRDNGDGSVGILPLLDQSLTLDIYGPIENGSKMELYYNEKNVKQRFSIIKYYNKYIEEGTYGWSGLKVKENGNGGTYLQYYKVGNGSKKLFLNFAIHGFEDSYSYDGAELTYMANQFYSYIRKNITEDLVNEWTIYILPTSNPDGQYNGWTNDGPGRTTLYSWAPGNKGIDMNRCFSVGYSSTGGNRNYNGTQPFQAFEAESLRDFILNHTGSQNIVLDIHGWMNETIGDDGIGWYYRNAFGLSKHVYSYGGGYLINWARSIPNTRSMLLELPQVWSHSDTVNWGYADKFNNATMQILRDF